MKKNISATVILLFSQVLFHSISCAQPYFDIANIYYQQSPGKSLFHSDENHLKTQLISVNLRAAFKIRNDRIVINPFCDYYRLQFPGNSTRELYGIGMGLTYFRQWKNEKWATAFSIIPRMSSEMKKVNENDYQVGGALLNIYKKNENLSCKFGAYYNSEFFGPYFMPLLGIDWKVSDRLTIFALLPSRVNLEYRLNKRFYTGIEMNFITSSYRYRDDAFLRINDNHAKIFLDAYLTKNIVLNIHAGQTVFRKYKSGFRESGTTTYMDLDVNDGLLLRAGIIYRLRLDQKKEAGK